ncbi:MAG: hypothetical protein ACFFBP_09150 [Promethearchaeota archaeon]
MPKKNPTKNTKLLDFILKPRIAKIIALNKSMLINRAKIDISGRLIVISNHLYIPL